MTASSSITMRIDPQTQTTTAQSLTLQHSCALQLQLLVGELLQQRTHTTSDSRPPSSRNRPNDTQPTGQRTFSWAPKRVPTTQTQNPYASLMQRAGSKQGLGLQATGDVSARQAHADVPGGVATGRLPPSPSLRSRPPVPTRTYRNSTAAAAVDGHRRDETPQPLPGTVD